MPTKKKPKKIYFAGALFNHKELIGNALLNQAIEYEADGKYQLHMPQNVETPQERAEAIRNEDLKSVLESDVALFNFDGTELDSGTVVEFMVAKFLDLPSVILRTDFRIGGDQEGNNWNLMCSFYPRTKIIEMNGMSWYQENREHIESGNFLKAYEGLAREILSAFNEVGSEPPLLANNPDQKKSIYEWVSRFAGSSFKNLVENRVDLKQLLNQN